MLDLSRICRALILSASAAAAVRAQAPSRLIVFEPGHFHATLLQKEMYPELDRRVTVYAPLGPELLDYLNRVSLFNARAVNPTAWELDIHTAPDTLPAMLREKRGNIVVFSGRNRGKIDRIQASLDAGLHVLADKPWIINADELPKLEAVLDAAPRKGLAAYDIMTERYEVTSQVQRALVSLADVFGRQVAGDAANPGVRAVSVHHIMKAVAEVPLRRPVWFFDVEDYGEGLADVGTHPVDLIQWTLFPGQVLDYRKEIRMLSGRHEAVRISREQFAKVTGAAEFPASFAAHLREGALDYFCNNYIAYTLRGVHVKLDVLWKWEAAPGTGDVYEAAFQGTRARVELRQGAAEKYIPEVYVVPDAAARTEVFAALDRAMPQLAKQFPGITAVHSATDAQLRIPAALRLGHEEHFARVAQHFFQYVKSPAAMPAWERSYMLAKYYVTTQGVALARK